MTKIVNRRRKKQTELFEDRNHEVMDEYYDAVEGGLSSSQMKRVMKRLIKLDPLFFDSYLVLADLLYEDGEQTKARELLEEMYRKALLRIVDAEGNWPKEMPWGWLENRHIMRALYRYAYQLWLEGEETEALDIFRRLLRANPGDNQGARYSILAILLDEGPDWEEQFVIQDGPAAGEGLDAMKVQEWFEKNAKKFPKEFGWLFQVWEERF